METIDILPIMRHINNWYDTHPEGYYSMEDVISDMGLKGNNGLPLVRQTVHARLKGSELGREILATMRERRRGISSILPAKILTIVHNPEIRSVFDSLFRFVTYSYASYDTLQEAIKEFNPPDFKAWVDRNSWAVVSDTFSLEFVPAREFWFVEEIDGPQIKLHQITSTTTTERYSPKDGIGLRYMWEEAHRLLARNNTTVNRSTTGKRPRQSGASVSNVSQHGT